MKALIVEDSRLAREEMKTLLNVHADVEIVGEAAHPDEALILIREQQPDVLFLDINMPGKNGFDLLEQLEECPIVVFTTAYSDYAIQSFDYNTLDYLLKPITSERLAFALEKIRAHFQSESQEMLDAHSRIFIKDGEQIFLAELAKIRYFETYGNYTRIYFDDFKPLIYKSLANIEARLPPEGFFRVNRQQIINIHFVEGIEKNNQDGLCLTMSDGAVIDASRRHALRIKKLLSI